MESSALTSAEYTRRLIEPALVLRSTLRIAVFAALMAAILFFSAGRMDWPMAWVYIGLFSASSLVSSLILLLGDPALWAERTGVKADVRSWDKVLAPLVIVYVPIAMWVVAGMDVRHGWSTPLPFELQLGTLAAAVPGICLANWAMKSNEFFSLYFRIQKERGHHVVSGGPYRYVRHPGYAGGLAFNLVTPILLGSLWAFIPVGLIACLFVLRTALEDRALRAELDGYGDYTQRVRYRLLPGVW
ncbi:MAG: isoprenylcysteine carboxylmethyltransferase family protein [Gemmatimonadota bacterium]|nr:MAG: isoprenylcysteine carboxylmethyltransferase family protein [Gemmatimonadota bacterium]